jgi:hypothetical protein
MRFRFYVELIVGGNLFANSAMAGASSATAVAGCTPSLGEAVIVGSQPRLRAIRSPGLFSKASNDITESSLGVYGVLLGKQQP